MWGRQKILNILENGKLYLDAHHNPLNNDKPCMVLAQAQPLKKSKGETYPKWRRMRKSERAKVQSENAKVRSENAKVRSENAKRKCEAKVWKCKIAKVRSENAKV